MDSISVKSLGNNLNASFKIKNPQIVNGCQTVNSIYEALNKIDPNKLDEEFKDCFVMLKILEINREDDNEKILYKDIVRYTNSQNSIKESTFIANRSEFLRLQTEFERKGFLLLIKQSDKHTFSEKY
ncbi:AIPR protein [Tissierella praeacuta DSM 18095]|uniref:AIPR protein n=2 Tax=Tissierella praeacuta TaxID=43131 RepID=A0A1M4UKU2_9FIRM|nr:AIPR family protein [Tissierella praeacuta]SHE57319.1 AIPR protein [Tissierella praeacuta DSM 18095]SUP03607.1 AIPR protein [Tissierella praeacuta]